MKFKFLALVCTAAIYLAAVPISYSQNPLLIPDTLSGTSFNLSVQTGTRNFILGFPTPTLGYNGDFLGPTLLINKGDSITLNVTNNLTTATTVHWHGLHVAAKNDGGPHQLILPGTTWSPSFVVRNHAGTFWYHPHGEGKTELQVSKGLAGMILIRDSAEVNYAIPRKYGIDDFPIVLQSKAFDGFSQIAIATHYDSVMMVNGTLNPFLEVPKQVVRLHLLNGSADRTYLLGLSDSSNFHLIASDGGFLSQPIAMDRLRLSPGERAEILLDFTAYTLGQSIQMISYASELAHGIIGADSVGTATNPIGEGYYTNPLNGADFVVLRLEIASATANPVTTIPTSFAPVIRLDTVGVNAHRSLHFEADTLQFGEVAMVDGPFSMNNQPFNMDSVNFVIPLNNKEIWTLTNSTKVAHPFHIHDVQFFVLDVNGNSPTAENNGLKDVILVMPNDTVRFITRFETFADEMVPYMYHCHLLHHEDDGMMGQFLVVNASTATTPKIQSDKQLVIFPNPASAFVQIATDLPLDKDASLEFNDVFGRRICMKQLDMDGKCNVENLPSGIYLVSLHHRRASWTAKLIKL